MKVDIYGSGSRPDWRLIVPSGQPVEPLANDVSTGVSTMVPLTLVATAVDLNLAMSGRRARSIASAVKGWGGAVARTSDFNNSVILDAAAENGGGR